MLGQPLTKVYYRTQNNREFILSILRDHPSASPIDLTQPQRSPIFKIVKRFVSRISVDIQNLIAKIETVSNIIAF